MWPWKKQMYLISFLFTLLFRKYYPSNIESEYSFKLKKKKKEKNVLLPRVETAY